MVASWLYSLVTAAGKGECGYVDHVGFAAVSTGSGRGQPDEIDLSHAE